MGRLIIGILFFLILFFTAFVDMRKKIVPDSLTIILFLLGIIKGFLLNESFENKIIGMSVLPIFFLILYGYGENLFKREVIGFGDIKLLWTIGFYIGYEGIYELLIFYNIIFLIAPIFGLLYYKYSKKSEVPFVPILAIGTLIFYIF